MTDPGPLAAPAAGPPRQRQWRRRRTVGFLAVCLLIFVLVAGCTSSRRSRPARGTLADLQGVGDLQARFNADRGQPRLIVIFSPT